MEDRLAHSQAAGAGAIPAEENGYALNLGIPCWHPSQRATGLYRALGGVGGITLLAGIFVAPQRAWPGALLAAYYVLGIALAGLFFVALQYLTGARWSVAFRRVPEAMAAVLPAAAVGMAIVLAASPWVYPWVGVSTEGPHSFSGFKHAWLNLPFFLARSAVYLTVWIAFGRVIVRNSRRQDADGDFAHTRRNIRLSAGFIVLFAVTLWLASFDWVMSLEPEWYSTIFGVYHFAGLFSSGLAAVIMLSIYLQRSGPFQGVLTRSHLHDLGKLLFGFSTFWMYIWFSQYMLIWYANIPEETVHFVRRLHGAWAPLFVLNIILNWGIPFSALLSRRVKQDPGAMLKVAAVVLAGRWLDLYLMIVPPFAGAGPVFGIWELGLTAGGIGGFLLMFFRAWHQAPPVPVRDPFLRESLHHHL